jgi:hypothetical protein
MARERYSLRTPPGGPAEADERDPSARTPRGCDQGISSAHRSGTAWSVLRKKGRSHQDGMRKTREPQAGGISSALTFRSGDYLACFLANRTLNIVLITAIPANQPRKPMTNTLPKVHIHTSSPDAFFVNSFIIEGVKSLVLVDTQFVLSKPAWSPRRLQGCKSPLPPF